MQTKPGLTVDCVIFKDEQVLLIRRGVEPFKGLYALPGRYVEIGETVEQACCREVLEETGITVYNLKLIGVYSDPKRDERRRNVSVAFAADSNFTSLHAGDDAESVELVSEWESKEIAFDHKLIIEDARKLVLKLK